MFHPKKKMCIYCIRHSLAILALVTIYCNTGGYPGVHRLTCGYVYVSLVKIMHDPSCLLLYLSLTFRQTNCRCPKSILLSSPFTFKHSYTLSLSHTNNKLHTFTKLTPTNIDPHACTHERTLTSTQTLVQSANGNVQYTLVIA